jgi:hypothetical protein
VFNLIPTYSFTSGVILDATYGYDVQDSQDQLMTLGRRTIEDATLAARPGAYLVDIFPWGMLFMYADYSYLIIMDISRSTSYLVSRYWL